jgi:hypothetical protein
MFRVILQAFVYPHVAYGLSIYGLTYPTHLKKIDVILNRFVRALTEIDLRESADPGYVTLRLDNVESLVKIRLAILMYALLNNPQKLPNILFLYPEPGGRNTRQLDNARLFYEIPYNEICKRKIELVGADLWNLLPDEVVDANSCNVFKLRVKYHIRNNNIILRLPASHLGIL